MKRNLSAYSHIIFYYYPNSQKIEGIFNEGLRKVLNTNFLWSSRRRHTSSFSSSDRRIVSPQSIHLGSVGETSVKMKFVETLMLVCLNHCIKSGVVYDNFLTAQPHCNQLSKGVRAFKLP